MTIQSLLNKLELNESAISTILGGLVLFAVAFLVFNYFTTRPKPIADNTPESDLIQQLEGKISATATKTYTVKKGDNLWKIAVDQLNDGYRWVDIARANDLDNPGLIEAGQELDIPREIGNKSQSLLEENQQKTPTSYTVQKGDNLWNIAVTVYHDGYRWSDIWENNKTIIENPNRIEVDQVLILPK